MIPDTHQFTAGDLLRFEQTEYEVLAVHGHKLWITRVGHDDYLPYTADDKIIRNDMTLQPRLLHRAGVRLSNLGKAFTWCPYDDEKSLLTILLYDDLTIEVEHHT